MQVTMRTSHILVFMAALLLAAGAVGEPTCLAPGANCAPDGNVTPTSSNPMKRCCGAGYTCIPQYIGVTCGSSACAYNPMAFSYRCKYVAGG
jgi:hypothetical protein